MAILIMTSPRAGNVAYAEWLADLDEELYLLAPAGVPVTGSYAEVLTFEDYEVNGAVQATAHRLFEERGYRTIVAKAECDLLRAARLREALGLPGQSLASATAYRDKTVMKAATAAAGIATPAFRRLSVLDDLAAFVREHGWPVLVKPLDGSGSTGVRVLRDAAELARFTEQGLPAGYEVEELVEGCLFHVDGLVLDGQVVLAHASRYVPPQGAIAIKADLAYGSHLLDPASPLSGRLRRFAERVVESLPSPERFSFHAEVFRTPADDLVFCEIASRTAGGMIADMLRLGPSVDLDRAWVQAQCGLAPDPSALGPAGTTPAPLAGRVLFPRRRGTLRSVPTVAPDWVARYRRRAGPGERFVGPAYDDRKSGDFVAGCIVLGDSEAEVERRMAAAVEWFDGAAAWETD